MLASFPVFYHHQYTPAHSLLRPDFDSPSVFCRLLDKDKGGYFSIHPQSDVTCTTKQQYLPSSNILQTRYIRDQGVVDVVDFFPRPKHSSVVPRGGPRQSGFREATTVQEELKQWLVRRVECIRGELALDVELFPAFDYALEPHVTTIVQPVHEPGSANSKTVTFHSKNLKLQLDVTIDKGEEDVDTCPSVIFKAEKRPGMLGEGVVARILVQEGQAISFVLRSDIENHVTKSITSAVLDLQQHDTQTFWYNWISKSKYKGRWREVVARSLLILKLMTYEPTGAIIAAPTFSIPEDVGGVRSVLPLLVVRDGWPLVRKPPLRLTLKIQKKLGLSLLLGTGRELHHLHPPPDGLHGRGRRLHGLHQPAYDEVSLT